MSKRIIVESYNPNWANLFLSLRDVIWPSVKELALRIEHVGSTSVVGLAAKPIIDIDIIVSDMSKLDQIIKALENIGYEYRGNLGVENREAFKSKSPIYAHNLYVCSKDCVALLNHLFLRDTLRDNPKLRDEYAKLKYKLAQEYPYSMDDYCEGKTEFILSILDQNKKLTEHLEAIRFINQAPIKSNN